MMPPRQAPRIRASDGAEQGGGGPLRRPPLFDLGQTFVTANAQMKLHPEDIQKALSSHQSGDWGEVDLEDWGANQNALADGLRLLSVYHDRHRVKFYIITEADRSITPVMLPEDY